MLNALPVSGFIEIEVFAVDDAGVSIDLNGQLILSIDAVADGTRVTSPVPAANFRVGENVLFIAAVAHGGGEITFFENFEYENLRLSGELS